MTKYVVRYELHLYLANLYIIHYVKYFRISVTEHPTIIADERIPYVREAFQSLGKLITLSGRDMNAITIRDADILIVRSITRVDELLIGKSNVQYVATASTGYDHIDTQYLEERGIHVFAAAGCNSNAVAEYVIVAIALLCRRYELQLDGLTIGIIGAGKIGARLAEKVTVLGMNVMLNDPPLREKTGNEKYLPLETVLQQTDIVTLHVPLTERTAHPTLKMVDTNFIKDMRSEAFLINTSRGAVADEEVLLNGLIDTRIRGAVIDVWENEPHINVSLLEKVDIGTPHIAGHSIDGKINATIMVYDDVCSYLDKKPEWRPERLPVPEHPVINLNMNDVRHEKIINALHHAYPIHIDDARLREISCTEEAARTNYFDTIRNEQHMRREFDSYRIISHDEEVTEILTKLGFQK